MTRLYRLLRLSALALLAAVLAVSLALLWLLYTASGRDTVLHQLAAHLPAGSRLQWQQAEGRLAGPLRLQGLRLEMPKQRNAACTPTPDMPCSMGTLHAHIEHAELDLALTPLLWRRLQLNTLTLRSITLDLPASNTPFELPQWPDVLPTLELPLSVYADAIAIDAFTLLQDSNPQLTLHRLRGGVRLGNGWAHFRHLQLDTDYGALHVHGRYAPRQNFRTDLHASATLKDNPVPVTLQAQGDLNAFTMEAEGKLPGATRLTLNLQGDANAPHWSLHAASQALDITQFSPAGHTVADTHADAASAASTPAPLRFTLTGKGIASHATLQAQLEHGVLQADADLQLSGSLDHWQLAGHARLQRDNKHATVDLQGAGTRQQMQIDALSAVMPQGRLDATGELQWAPAITWRTEAQLAGFDPGYFIADWPGALQGKISSQGQQRSDGTWQAHVDAQELAGQLRQRPLRGHAKLDMDGNHYRADIALRMGKSQLVAKGRMDDVIDLQAQFSPVYLADLLPNSSGQIQGMFSLHGARQTPDIHADLHGQDVALFGYQAKRFRIDGRLPWGKDHGQLVLDAEQLDLGLPLQQLQLQLQGALSQFQLDARASSEYGTLSFTGSAQQRGTRWSGQLDTLTLQPAQSSAWSLQAATQWAWDGRQAQLSPACLQASLGGTLCMHANWPKQGFNLQGNDLPLTLASDFLPKREDGRPWFVHGNIQLDAQLQPTRNAWQANVSLRSERGGLRDRQRSRRDLLNYQQLQLDARIDPDSIDATLNAALGNHGKITAHVETGWLPTSPLSGTLNAQTTDLLWVELLSPDLVEPTGALAVDVQLSGSQAQPHLGGQGQLQQFNAELPALGIALQNGTIHLQAREDGSASINGTLSTGQGELHVDGSLGWLDDATPLQVSIHGHDVLLADTRQLRLLASPQLTLAYRAGEPMQVRGEIEIPEADIHLERLESGISPSADVVVVDPVRALEASALPMDITLVMRLGERVRLDGYGLNGQLTGNLQLRQPARRDMRAVGALDVSGRYRAYGQDLRITQGKLIWSNTAVDDPLLDMRAEREVGEVTAGVAVKGRASAPQVSVWSNPAMSQSEALAYLTLGRSLPSLSSREAEQINVAKSALNAGVGLLAAELGSRIGLDEAGVSQSRALGGEVLGVGKYLSPKLYVSYGVSLLGTGQVVTLKYLLRKGFDLQIESSTLENKSSVNWRKEK